METGLTRNEIVTLLARSEHGKLAAYTKDVTRAFKDEPEFTAHLIAWNHVNGQIRDAKIALPLISLTTPGLDAELAENSWAHLSKLGVRELLKAYRFALELKPRPSMRPLRRLIEQKVRELESNRHEWNVVALQHRNTLKEIYGLLRIKPAEFADKILFKEEYPKGSSFEAVAKLKTFGPADIAEAIVKFKIPFLVASGALGGKMKNTDVVLALIKAMTATELVTNMKMLEKLGVKTDPVLRAALEEGMQKVAKSTKNVLKTSAAAAAITDEKLKAKLQGAQERQLQNMKGVEGNWLVLGDVSGSMTHTIDISTQVSATLAKMVKGKVHLVFFNTSPTPYEVTGKALDEIQKMVRLVRAGGGTNIGCGLDWALQKGLEIDGVAVVSDGEDGYNTFTAAHKKLCEKLGKEIPVYMYDCPGGSNNFTRTQRANGIQIEEFDLRGKTIDYYSLPNLVQTMRTNRYSLVDEILEVPLLKMSTKTKGKEKAHDHATA